MTTTLRDGSTVEDRRLDRLPQRSPGNDAFPVRGLMGLMGAVPPPRPKRGRTWRPRLGLDQGREGQCVLHACAHWRNARPTALTPPISETPIDKARLREDYWEVQRRDPWVGGEYPGANPVYGGTSVLSAMQYGVEKGWWGSYWWSGADGSDMLTDTLRGLVTVGGGIAGLNWYASMYDPHPSGLMEVDKSSGTVGGHALYFPGARLKMRLKGEWRGEKTVYLAQQSWGLDHGVPDLGLPGGIVYFTEDALGALLEDAGEFVFPVKAKPATV